MDLTQILPFLLKTSSSALLCARNLYGQTGTARLHYGRGVYADSCGFNSRLFSKERNA